MDLTEILAAINEDWKIMLFVFGLGAAWYQGKEWFKKLTDSLEHTSTVHSSQNAILDSIHDKLDGLDKRIARIEGSVEMIQVDSREQAIKIAVLESQTNNIIEHPSAPKRRIRRQQ